MPTASRSALASRRTFLYAMVVAALAFPPRPSEAQCNYCSGTPLKVGRCPIDAKCKYVRNAMGNFIEDPANPEWCLGPESECTGFPNCVDPILTPEALEVIPTGGGNYTVRRRVDVKAGYNWWAGQEDHPIDGPPNPNPWKNLPGRLNIHWNTLSGGSPSLCQYFDSDEVVAFIEANNLTCAGAPYVLGPFKLETWACGCNQFLCGFPNCETCGSCGRATVMDVDFIVTDADLGCSPLPPAPPCSESGSTSSGASGSTCSECVRTASGGPGGAGCAVSVAEGTPSCMPDFMGKAQMRYAAGGVGSDGLPGTAAWRTVLGRGWSHEYAERIVVDPNNSHVWLLSRYGSFREFFNLATPVGGLRLYQSHTPSDEFRKLYFDTGTNGWRLVSLDGRTDFFRPDGLWEKTVFATDPTHPVLATYNGSNQLVAVSFPDGRSDTFTYASGKLNSVTENPVAGSGTPSRTWTFTWTGDELTLATRPDGTAWQFFYDPTRPGYLTRVDLVAGPQLRIEAAFEYEPGTNNVAKSWRGDPSFTGSNATDKITYSYTNPSLPTQAVVTRAVSGTFDQVTTYNIARDTVSRKPKLNSIQGSCPTCGLSPVTTFAYTGTNPLLPSSMTDAKGTRTDYTYDANGRLLTRTEAANVPSLTRLTTFIYDTNFPGLVTRVEVPSTSGGSNKRRTDSAYNSTTGLMTTRTIDGFEAGAALPSGFKTTTYSHNGSGEVLSIDPPGFGTTDVTSFTYNVSGRNDHIADSRTDPLTGTTLFEYDGLNRRTSVTDPNNLETETTYDTLNRITEVRQKGATPAGELVTIHVYNNFGDLFCTRLPRGNGIEYLYDPAGRLKEIVRGTAIATPTSTTCLDTALPRERTVYQLNIAGNRIEESLEEWTGSAWTSRSRTTYDYTCHLDRITHGAGSPSPAVTQYCYDLNDNLEKVWDANHPAGSNPTPTQLYAYDELNRLESVTQPWTGAGGTTAVTLYTYDVQDHLSSVIDAEGNVTTYTYSDRDLMTQEFSPVSNTTNHTYNEHGELLTTTDARGVVTTRTVDAADRTTQETFGPTGTPDPALTITYGYGTNPAQFNMGRLISITRNGETIAYSYDRFGRITQDGELSYDYDPNGNPISLVYPGGVEAVSTFDFADRPATLLARRAGHPDQPLVTAATYRPFGPLSTLTLGNGLTETHGFNSRYVPEDITLAGGGNLLSWTYTTDGVGNILSITDNLNAANNRGYGYQDPQYFLTLGNGPWGPRSWTYDKIGNRLTEVRGAVTDTYSYVPAPGGGHTPILTSIQLGGGGGTRTYDYGLAGHLEEVATGTDVTLFGTDAAGRLALLERPAGYSDASFAYDGRGYLTFADPNALPFLDGFESGNTCNWSAAVGQSPPPTCPGPKQELHSTYSSEGLLHALARNIAPQSSHVFHFAGRPVAQRDVSGGVESWKYLTADHLGTPIIATNTGGSVLWQGGFEPFGTDWSNSTGAGVFLRFPGQWREAAWENSGPGNGPYYNLYRWYEAGTGRYTQPDPLDEGSYAYALNRPLSFIDPTGEMPGMPPPPWHPDPGIKTACDPLDDCPTIKKKMFTLILMIRSHQEWDWRVPRPRGGNRHVSDIAQLWKQYAVCQDLYEKKDCDGQITRCVRRVKEVVGDAVMDILQWLADHPPQPIPPPLPGPFVPVPIP